jgi:hypothetical protein
MPPAYTRVLFISFSICETSFHFCHDITSFSYSSALRLAVLSMSYLAFGTGLIPIQRTANTRMKCPLENNGTSPTPEASQILHRCSVFIINPAAIRAIPAALFGNASEREPKGVL